MTHGGGAVAHGAGRDERLRRAQRRAFERMQQALGAGEAFRGALESLIEALEDYVEGGYGRESRDERVHAAL